MIDDVLCLNKSCLHAGIPAQKFLFVVTPLTVSCVQSISVDDNISI